MTGFRKLWDRIAKLGELPADVTPHVLRHSFASLAADSAIRDRRLPRWSDTRGTRSRPATCTRPMRCCLPQRTRWRTKQRTAWATQRPPQRLS